MKEAIWKRIGPVTGILWFALAYIGLSIHGYPDIRTTDAQLARWLATVDVNSFSLGIYIEALGLVLFIPFTAWLYGHLKQGGSGSSWPALVMLAAAVGSVILALPQNELYVAIVEQGRKGLDIRLAQTVLSISQGWFEMTTVVLTLILVAAGVSILRGDVMSRWAGWVAIVIGLALLVPAAFFLHPVADLWFLAVAVYYTVRPSRVRERAVDAAQPVFATGLPTAT